MFSTDDNSIVVENVESSQCDLLESIELTKIFQNNPLTDLEEEIAIIYNDYETSKRNKKHKCKSNYEQNIDMDSTNSGDNFNICSSDDGYNQINCTSKKEVQTTTYYVNKNGITSNETQVINCIIDSGDNPNRSSSVNGNDNSVGIVNCAMYDEHQGNSANEHASDCQKKEEETTISGVSPIEYTIDDIAEDAVTLQNVSIINDNEQSTSTEGARGVDKDDERISTVANIQQQQQQQQQQLQGRKSSSLYKKHTMELCEQSGTPPAYKTFIEIFLNDEPPHYEDVTGLGLNVDEIMFEEKPEENINSGNRRGRNASSSEVKMSPGAVRVIVVLIVIFLLTAITIITARVI